MQSPSFGLRSLKINGSQGAALAVATRFSIASQVGIRHASHTRSVVANFRFRGLGMVPNPHVQARALAYGLLPALSLVVNVSVNVFSPHGASPP